MMKIVILKRREEKRREEKRREEKIGLLNKYLSAIPFIQLQL